MSNVFCVKLQKQAPGLAAAPYPGELGQRILANVSQEAWRQWLSHQTLIINEKRLSLADPAARALLAKEMEAYFFGAGSATPDGFVEVSKTNK